jgi:hypothetical protein
MNKGLKPSQAVQLNRHLREVLCESNQCSTLSESELEQAIKRDTRELQSDVVILRHTEEWRCAQRKHFLEKRVSRALKTGSVINEDLQELSSLNAQQIQQAPDNVCDTSKEATMYDSESNTESCSEPIAEDAERYLNAIRMSAGSGKVDAHLAVSVCVSYGRQENIIGQIFADDATTFAQARQMIHEMLERSADTTGVGESYSFSLNDGLLVSTNEELYLTVLMATGKKLNLRPATWITLPPESELAATSYAAVR